MKHWRQITPRIALFALAVGAMLGGAACGPSQGGAADASGSLDGGPDAGAGLPPPGGLQYGCPPIRSELISEGSTTLPSGAVRSYQLLRLKDACGQRSYAQWIPAESPGPRPAILLTMPYAGISWSEEAVDLRWSSQPPNQTGSYPDVDGPGLRPSSGPVGYNLMAANDAAAAAVLYLIQDMGVLAVYGRFYAGGDIQNEVSDMIAGLRYLAGSPQVDPKRVGIFGGSWGGFEALYAAARATGSKGAVIPAACAAVSPLSDMAAQFRYIDSLPSRIADATKLSSFQLAFDAYERRIMATTGGRPDAPDSDFTAWRSGSVASTLQTPTLILHDSWDTLIPFESSQALVQAKPALISPMWFVHDSPPDFATLPLEHGPLMTEGVAYPVIYTFSLAFLFTRILPEQSILLPIDAVAVHAYFVELHRLQVKGTDLAWAARRLIDLADPRIATYDLALSANGPTGAQLVATELNAGWGTTYTADTVAAVLTKGLPPL